jgi:hypothetical protein
MFSVQERSIKEKSKDWFALNQDNASIRGLLFQ